MGALLIENDRDLLEFSARMEAALLRLDVDVGDRNGRGWLQSIADTFHVSHTAVRKWLNAESMPDMKKMARIAKRCRVNVNWLANGEGDMEIVHLSTDERCVVLHFRAADQRGKHYILTTAETQAGYHQS
jgi:transcriptional regulator with XRE-family HTH domain